MKKILIYLCLFVGFFFNFTSIHAYEGENLDNLIRNKLESYFKEYEITYGREKTIETFRKINDTILDKIETNIPLEKINIYRKIGNHIFVMLYTKDDEEITAKDLGNGVIIKQNKNGMGYTNVYAYEKQIFSFSTFSKSLCSPFSSPDFCDHPIYPIGDVYNLSKEEQEEIKETVLKNFSAADIEDPDFSILQISFWSAFTHHLVDIKNKKVFNDYSGPISNFRSGNSGKYYMTNGWGSSKLIWINNQNKAIELFSNIGKIELKDYELMAGGEIKLLKIESIKNQEILSEEIININDFK